MSTEANMADEKSLTDKNSKPEEIKSDYSNLYTDFKLALLFTIPIFIIIFSIDKEDPTEEPPKISHDFTVLNVEQ